MAERAPRWPGLAWLKSAGLKRETREPPLLRLGERDLPIAIRRLGRARRLTLRITRNGHLHLTIPDWVAESEALAFARARAGWVATQLASLAPATALGPGSAIPYRGETLRLVWEASAPRRVRLAPGGLHLGGPIDALEARVRRWLEAEARRLCLADLAEYAQRAGLAPPPLALSRAQRRWGSCSAKGAIRINWRLVMAPDAVRRSVVAHEVAHLRHFDHSPRFHATLAAIFEGDLAAADRWLKHEGRGLYALFC
ncbi:MAG: M48 family metallopeptidase [Sphingomonadales bacterium]|nr:M48 family metallopeptidase [Sphingomonadales bacterium]